MSYWEGDYSLDLVVEYCDLGDGWWIYDKSKNYKYSYLWKQNTKPTGRALRKRLQWCYTDARNYFDWNRM